MGLGYAKPVHWCPSCATALAETEIEFSKKTSPSIYVKFELKKEALSAFSELAQAMKRSSAERAFIVIWTTTPWTLPANLGLALHPEFDYVALPAPTLDGTELWIVAKGLQASFEKAVGFEKSIPPALIFKGERLHRQSAKHPFMDRDSLIVLSDHVSLEVGTGVMHTAPGHGVDDYNIGMCYGLDIFSPVDDRGRFDVGFDEMQGQYVFDSNDAIIEKLRDSGHLVTLTDIAHSYPHCRRCHHAVIFRTTRRCALTFGGSV
ncbi:hypothetical protein WDW86_17390 [Bdellovibrionota bacterium FG-2]